MMHLLHGEGWKLNIEIEPSMFYFDEAHGYLSAPELVRFADELFALTVGLDPGGNVLFTVEREKLHDEADILFRNPANGSWFGVRKLESLFTLHTYNNCWYPGAVRPLAAHLHNIGVRGYI